MDFTVPKPDDGENVAARIKQGDNVVELTKETREELKEML